MQGIVDCRSDFEVLVRSEKCSSDIFFYLGGGPVIHQFRNMQSPLNLRHIFIGAGRRPQ